MKSFASKLILISSVFFQIVYGQTFTESMGTVTATTSIAAHETANGFNNVGFTMSGTADLRNNTFSSGYTGASGGANVLINGSQYFQIAGVSTDGCSSLSLSFGVYKGGGSFSNLILSYSLDGTTFTPITYTTVSAANTTWTLATATIPAAAQGQSSIILRWLHSGSIQYRIDDVVLSGTCVTNTITTGAVSTAPFTVTCSTGTAGSVSFTATGTFASGNVFTAQLSNASGSFSVPVAIGSLTSTSPGTINFTIPPGTVSGSNYLIRVVSSSPISTGSNSLPFSINLSGGPCALIPPHITSLLYDGCNSGSCSNEGESEIVFATTGSYSLLVNSANIDLNYTPGSYNLLGSIVNVAAKTTAINTAAGCSGLYQNAFNQTLPPNSKILFVSSDVCVGVFDWAALCGNGPIYIVYGQSGLATNDRWVATGNFGNSGGAKSFETVIRTTDNTTHTITYNYTPSGGDGAYATYGSNPPGGAPATTGVFTNCSITPVVLSEELTEFVANAEQFENVLKWTTASERNNSHFVVHHSVDGVNWEAIGEVVAYGTTNEIHHYSLVHSTPPKGINYYKLSAIDIYGKDTYKKIILLENKKNYVFYNENTKTIHLQEIADVEVFSSDGRFVLSSSGMTTIPIQTSSGIYLVHFKKTGNIERLLIK